MAAAAPTDIGIVDVTLMMITMMMMMMMMITMMMMMMAMVVMAMWLLVYGLLGAIIFNGNVRKISRTSSPTSILNLKSMTLCLLRFDLLPPFKEVDKHLSCIDVVRAGLEIIIFFFFSFCSFSAWKYRSKAKKKTYEI